MRGPGEATDARRLSIETLDAYWRSGNEIEIPLRGTPEVRLRLDPPHDEIALVTPFGGSEPDVARLKNLTLRRYLRDGSEWADVRIKVRGSAHGAFAVLTTIADRVQISGESLALAIPSAIAEHKGVLAVRSALTTEREIGLFGELLTIDHLMGSVGAAAAAAAWAGPLLEEHDIVLPEAHIEVKTTVGERRKHVISNIQQLVPTPRIPLWLLSIQVTRAVPSGGRTLRQLVTDVRRSAGDARPVIDARLDDFGWDDEFSEIYTTAWTLRSLPRSYLVDVEFPALTEERLRAMVPCAQLLSDVTYRIDVTDMDYATAPHSIAGFAEHSEGGER